jgi:hypothetical protein
LSVRSLWIATAASLSLVVFLQTVQSSAQTNIKVRADRWLEVQHLIGKVTRQQGNSSQPARVGDRLQSIGDGISTSSKSSTRLAVDTNVGFVNVAENTTLRIQSLQVASDKGRITRLHVAKGQVRLQVRPFNHKGSRLELVTPSGISGVRGTEFGVAVQPSGKTGLATLKGGVLSSAKGQAYLVNGGFQNFTISGEPPSRPVPLRNDTSFVYKVEIVIDRGIRKLRLIGQTDPVNAVFVEDEPQSTDRQGRFNILLPMPSYPIYQVTIITPLGKKQEHEVVF